MSRLLWIAGVGLLVSTMPENASAACPGQPTFKWNATCTQVVLSGPCAALGDTPTATDNRTTNLFPADGTGSCTGTASAPSYTFTFATTDVSVGDTVTVEDASTSGSCGDIIHAPVAVPACTVPMVPASSPWSLVLTVTAMLAVAVWQFGSRRGAAV